MNHEPMKMRPLVLLGAIVSIAAFLALGSGCELAVQLDSSLADASIADSCAICADVSADANYDAADVTIDGLQPGDAGTADARADATVSADGQAQHDASADGD
jgi:hypothetical protein